MSESRSGMWRMGAAGVAGAVFALVGVHWLSGAQAQSPGGMVLPDGESIPAIEIREGSIALVKGPGNQYFVVDRQGNGYPVRYRDLDATPPVGSTLLRSP